MEANDQSSDLDDVERRIRRQRIVVACAMVAVVLVYSIGVLLGDPNCISAKAEVWGQFGDYIGGILNPTIAFLAYYWLTNSYLVQKRELHETKVALSSSAASQELQARHAERAARISALAAGLSYANSEVDALRGEIKRVYDLSRAVVSFIAFDGSEIQGHEEIRAYRKELGARIEKARQEQSRLVAEISQLMKEA